MTDWILKIIALLHDPPEKTLGLKGHQPRAFQLMEQVLGPREFQARFGKAASQLTRKDFEASAEGERVKQADQVASAIDRAAFPPSVRLGSSAFLQNLQVRHPFCAQPLSLKSVSDFAAIQRQTNLILSCVNRQVEPRKKYLALWRAIPQLAPDSVTRLLPADTRIVDHPLWAHLDATAALATALPDITLLHVGVGPVQDFIHQARRTQDLWMGSHLLSYLTWMGIKAVVEQHGPDSIIYPALRGQPLVDAWLKGELGELPPGAPPPDLTMATIPNKFVAAVPSAEVRGNDGLPDRIMEAVRGAWRNIAREVHDKFPGGSRSGEWKKIWKRQTLSDDWPEVYWSAVCWPNVDLFAQIKGPEEALRIVESCLGKQESYRLLLDTYRQSWPAGTHVGTMYGALHKLLTTALDARKHSRDFVAREEDGEKCTLMPELSALRLDGRSRRSEVREYWQEVAKDLRRKDRAHEIKADGSERLSAVAAIKRFARQSCFGGTHMAFPSTSRLAAVPFYRQLLERLSADLGLQHILREHLDALRGLNYPGVSGRADEKALPALGSMVEALADEPRNLAESLFQFEADVLYPERLDSHRLEREYGEIECQAAGKAQQTCRTLHRAVSAPPTYYAILLMDGDDMGKWLAGEHPHMPHFKEAMHPDVLPKFQSIPEPDRGKWNSLLGCPRPLAANLHASLSSALSTFVLRGVKFIIEQRHFGRVVYAGGDDVLALLPLPEALSAARELYMLFTGRAKVKDGRIELDPSSRNGYVEWNDEILLMPGPRITLSAGIAIAHHLYPLDAALEAARKAKQAAKKVPDKAAVCVRALKRSGETLEVRSRWDDMGLFNQMVEHFSNDRLSSGFVYDMHDRARLVTALPTNACRATIKQLIERHKARQLTEFENLVERLWEWEQALNVQVLPEKGGDREVPQGFAELCRWVALARFVAKGGGE